MAEEQSLGLDSPSDKSLPSQMPAIPPLLLDEESPTEDTFENQALEDMQRYQRAAAARTVYHQRRADDDTLNSTCSLYDSDVLYHEIYTSPESYRRYCKDYYMPNDEEEQTRLQMLNGVYFSVLQGLTTVPLDDSPKKKLDILDLGCGTGEWCIEMGEKYPNSEVIGTDIANIQARAAPPNVFWELDDAEEDGGWTWPDDKFDLVHFRYLCGAFRDWNQIYREALKKLKPGGYIEILDFDDHRGLLSFYDEDSEVPRWLQATVEGARRAGRPRTTSHLEPESLEKLGFVDVKSTDYDIPIGTWPDDEEKQKTGTHFLVATLSGCEALCLRVLTEQMGWDVQEVKRVCSIVEKETWTRSRDLERGQGMGFKLKVLTGKKPSGSVEERSSTMQSS